jgi:8-oxo-dGTP diphosphatase
MEKKKHIVNITAVIKNPSGDKFLIVQRSKHEIAYPGKWGFPGGKVEKGETITDTLKREILEEVGLEIENEKEYILDYTFVRPDGHNVVGMCFAVKAKSEDVKLLSKDFDDYKWIHPNELKDFDHVERMDEVIELAFKN